MDTVKYKRSMVFMVFEDQDITDAIMRSGTRTICKTRPYVLLSTTDFMSSERHALFVAAPISSKVETFYDGDVRFVDNLGETNKICVNQIRTIDRRNIREYLFTLSDQVMRAVDDNLYRTLGIPSAEDVRREERQAAKAAEPVQHEPDEEVEEPSLNIKEIDGSTFPLVKLEPVPTHTSGISENAEILMKHGRSSRVIIKDDNIFMEDADKMNMAELARYYGFNNAEACSQRLRYIKKKHSQTAV